MNYVRTRLASTRFSAFYFLISPFFPAFFVPLLPTPKVSREGHLLVLRRGVNEVPYFWFFQYVAADSFFERMVGPGEAFVLAQVFRP
jgi:hypothetical protein